MTQLFTYAGPWAEARAQWTLPTLEGEDDDGCWFEDYVAAALLRNADGDGDDYRRAQDADSAMYGPEFGHLAYEREEIWSRELEQSWPIIQQLAAMLLDGPVCAEAVAQLISDGVYGDYRPEIYPSG